jgi:di/tricarboxylate transporter
MVFLLMVVACILRLAIPNIGGFLALLLPVSMALAREVGLNPLVVGLLLTATGDAVLYYPAQGTTAIMVFERGHLTTYEVLRVGLGMTVLAFSILLFVALPYWALLGEPLVP